MTKDSADLPRFEALTLTEQDDTLQHRAALYVASIARDTADARQLLDALGFIGPTVRTHGLDGWRAGCICKRCRRAGARHQQTGTPTTTTVDAPANTREVTR